MRVENTISLPIEAEMGFVDMDGDGNGAEYHFEIVMTTIQIVQFRCEWYLRHLVMKFLIVMTFYKGNAGATDTGFWDINFYINDEDGYGIQMLVMEVIMILRCTECH